MSMIYKHTQIGYVILISLLVATIIFEFILTQTDFNLFIFVSMLLILFILASFTMLTIIVDEKHLKIRFGYGIFKKHFLIKEIVSVKTVKNHWYYGWGIRLWLWPYRWIYNVSGFSAIEIIMKNGKHYRIGTNEPKKLEQIVAAQLLQ